MAGTHKRNTTAMHNSPRCGAKTRKGTPCQAPAVWGKYRCRMHGGSHGSGAPLGNQNARIQRELYQGPAETILEALLSGNEKAFDAINNIGPEEDFFERMREIRKQLDAGLFAVDKGEDL